MINTKKRIVPIIYTIVIRNGHRAGADPGFQVRGGAIKKNVPYGERREHFSGISCEKS